MSTLPEQFSEARKSQVAAQLDLFRNFSSKAVESAEKVIALNLSTSRASVEQSAATLRQLFAAKDPRDLLALTTTTQQNFERFLAYGSALFSIASDARLSFPQATAASASPALTRDATPAPLAAEPVEQPAPGVMAEAAPPAAAETLPEAVPEPVARATPIAQAISQVVAPEPADQPAAAPIPAAKVRAVEVPAVKPAELSSGKSAKKK